MDASGGTRVRGAIAILAFVLLGSGAEATTQVLFGVNAVRFAWSAAKGNPQEYLVAVSRDGGPLVPQEWVSKNVAEVPVAPYERIAVAVMARRRDAKGSYEYGRLSPLSDEILIWPSPTFAHDGLWTLHCALCPSVATRSLADASILLDEVAAPSGAKIVGRARLGKTAALVWQDPASGTLDLWDAKDLVPIPGGRAVGRRDLRMVGSADFDGDGREELVFHDPVHNTVDIWTLGGARLALQATLPGVVGGLVAGVGDLDRDGRVEILWNRPNLGAITSWTIVGPLALRPDPGALIAPGPHVVFGYPKDARVVRLADFDGDGHRDLLWRFGDGSLHITYLVKGRDVGFANLPDAPDGVARSVVGAVDLDGQPGAEIALREDATGVLMVLLPRSQPVKWVRVLSPGRRWTVADVSR